MYIYVKNGVSIIEDRDTNLIHFSVSTSDKHKVYKVNKIYRLFLKLLLHDNNLNAIFNLMRIEFPNFSKNDLIKNIFLLKEDGILEISNTPLSRNREDKYSRQIEYLSDLNPKVYDSSIFQKNIENSCVFIIGAGGIGSWMLQSLTMLGIGKIIVCDGDVVKIHNLTRQSLYNTNDLGKKKVYSIYKHLKELNPKTTIIPINKQINNEKDIINLEKYIKESNLVINCADHPDINTTSQWVSNICMKLKIPHMIGGGYDGHIGMIGPTIIPYETACWNCFKIDNESKLRKDNFKVLFNSRKSAGSIVSLSSIIANIQVNDAMLLLTKVATPLLINKKGLLNMEYLNINWINVPRNKLCPICGLNINR